ncbi:TPA: hypothetical protein DCZ31_00460 [Patescibacteria group bacterium]|nr:hypothetical protein [Candidatus Gracilibacteria bacterium]
MMRFAIFGKITQIFQWFWLIKISQFFLISISSILFITSLWLGVIISTLKLTFLISAGFFIASINLGSFRQNREFSINSAIVFGFFRLILPLDAITLPSLYRVTKLKFLVFKSGCFEIQSSSRVGIFFSFK